GAIGTDDANVANGAGQGTGNQALLGVIKPRYVALLVRALLTADNGHTVVGFLAGPVGFVTRLAALVDGKAVVCLLEFLQTQGIDRVVGKPVQNLRKTHIERIDIPGS